MNRSGRLFSADECVPEKLLGYRLYRFTNDWHTFSCLPRSSRGPLTANSGLLE